MFTMQFWKDAVERMLKTVAEVLLAYLGVGEFLNAFSVNWGEAGGVALGAAILSILFSLASNNLGRSGTASLTEAVKPNQ
jgi:hypothetical protein